jgi:hypothetical protein
MNFTTITVFEKEGAQVEAEMWATPGWFKMSQCFVYENNPYISKMDLKANQEGSYLEVYIEYHSKEAYEAWHAEWKHIHDELRFKVMENLKTRGIDNKLYWPDQGIPAPENETAYSLDQFVSKITN